jgi:molybdopterin-synthase adenylyltransferase
VTGAARYARHVALPEVGAAGQERLARARVLVVGLGGLGCPAAQYLAASGVGTLLVNDFDTVDESNLPRQILYGPADVGKLKVEVARSRLAALNPEARIRPLAERLETDALAAIVAEVDVALDGSDNFPTRLGVNRACVAQRVPLVSGAALRFEGQLAVFPNAPGGPCYECLYDDEDEWLGNCRGNGVLAPVTGVIGTMMALEAIKLLLGLESGAHNRLLLWDAKRGEWHDVTLKPDPDCAVCSAKR